MEELLSPPLGFVPLRKAIEAASEAWKLEAKQAYERLRPYLRAGEVDGVVAFDNGSEKKIWSEWGARVNDDAFVDGCLRWGSDRWNEPYVNQAFVCTADLMKLLGREGHNSPSPDATTAILTAPPRSKGGRPSEYDWDGMWIEAARLIFYDGIPASDLELRKRLLEWFSTTHGTEPSVNAIKPKVDRLWKALRKQERQ